MLYDLSCLVLMCVCRLVFFFFFKQKTAYEMRISDWSSDVCSSDLVWATLGSERLHQIAIPDRVRRLVLFPDNDVAGEIGVAHALESYAMPGRDIDIEFPPAGFKDWNDVLRMGGEGVGEWWRKVA